MAKKFHFPVWLVGTLEEQAAEAQRQEVARATHTRARLTEAERLVGRGALLEQTARQNLEQAKGKNAQARELAENQLADALAMQGKYPEAAEVHNGKHRRAYFREVIKAIELPDDEKCTCPDSKGRLGEIEVAITPRFERGQIFSPIHGEVVSLVECSKCGHTNARKMKSRLLKHRDALGRSEGSKQTILADVHILNADS